MNEKIIKNSRAGFGFNDTLLSRIKFSGIIRVWEKSKVEKEIYHDKVTYWVIKDEYGASFSCFYEVIVNSLVIGETYEVSGDLKIGKGGMFLNLKKIKEMNGKDFTEEI